jgi:hypothetical protein
VQTFRWLLLGSSPALAAATVASRDHHPARAVAFADAGGLTALALALTLVVDQVFGSSPLFGPGAGTGWELFLYACGFGLCAFSAVDRAPGPGWIGVAVLLATTVAAAGGKATLIGWPLVLASAPAGCSPSVCARAAAAARALARRGPRLRDQERAVSDLKEALDRALGGGPERHHDKAREQGKLPVRERVDRLLDDGSFAEEALLANWEGEGLGADGVVTGLGRLAGGRWR